MPDPLIVIGSGGNGLDVLDIVDAINARSMRWRVVGFLDDGVTPGTVVAGVEVVGGLKDAARFPECRFVNSIGAERSYARRPEILAATGLAADRWETLVHPGAHVSPRARIGRGAYVCAGAVLASNVTVGDQATIHPGCVLGHDSAVGEYSIVAPGATLSGFVKVARCAYVGARAVVRQGLAVGEKALVGMGAVVVKDVAAGVVVVGSPARELRRAGSDGP